jgi:nucleotide-binding universal stress UspA family protein
VYSKILVPLDGSKLAEQILPLVKVIAAVTQAPVELLRVKDPEKVADRAPPRQIREYLDEGTRQFFSNASSVHNKLELGDPAEIIIERARADPTCLIAMATHGMAGMRRWLIGSVANKVAHTAVNPLLLLRPAENCEPNGVTQIKTIFVPLDGSVLAERALRPALDLATRLNGEIHLLRVYTLPANAYVVANGMMDQAPTRVGAALRETAQSYLDGKVEELRANGLDRVVATAIEGDPASELIDIEVNTSNSLIVMTSHGRTGAGRWLLGSVAEKVIQHARAPVLLIRAS